MVAAGGHPGQVSLPPGRRARWLARTGRLDPLTPSGALSRWRASRHSEPAADNNAIGLMFGLAAALGVGPWLSSLLFGLPPRDGFVVATAAAALALTGALANWLPARRAARIDPVRSLRTE